MRATDAGFGSRRQRSDDFYKLVGGCNGFSKIKVKEEALCLVIKANVYSVQWRELRSVRERDNFLMKSESS